MNCRETCSCCTRDADALHRGLVVGLFLGVLWGFCGALSVFIIWG